MKKFSIFLPLFLTSFFFIPFKVNAQDYNYTIPSSVFDVITSDLFTMRATVESFISNDSSYYNNYVIFYQSAYTQPYFFCVSKQSSSPFIYAVQSNSSKKPYALTFTLGAYKDCFDFSSDYTSVGSLASIGAVASIYSSNYVVYSSSAIYFNNTSSDNFIISYGGNSYTISPLSTSVSGPSIYDLYVLWYGTPSPPVPPDDTPLLTSFIDISLDKLSYICEFFTSSYVYLSIFTVFLLYFVILLFRRFR